MRKPILLMLVCLGFCNPSVFAADTRMLDITTDIYVLIAETTMVSIEVDPVKHAAKAKEIMDRLGNSMPAAISQVAGKDANRAADLKMQWEDLQSAYEGETFAIAFRESTFDTNLTARYTSGSDALLMAFRPLAATEAAASPVQTTRLRVLQTLANYLRISTGIVGGTSFSANDQDNDIPASVATIDRELAALKKAYAGKPQAAALKQADSRWAFLRPALLKSGNESAPFIVFTHGLNIANALNELEGNAR